VTAVSVSEVKIGNFEGGQMYRVGEALWAYPKFFAERGVHIQLHLEKEDTHKMELICGFRKNGSTPSFWSVKESYAVSSSVRPFIVFDELSEAIVTIIC
jgi:hypothetical protein